MANTTHPAPANLKNILFIVAMDGERTALESRESNDKFETLLLSKPLNLSVDKLSINSKRNLYVMKTGVGSVNAAVHCAFAIDQLSIDCILLLGVCGALSPDLNIGDTLIADSVLQHDSIFTSEDSINFMAAGDLYLSSGKENRLDPIISTYAPLNDELYPFLLKKKKSDQHIFRGRLTSGGEFVGCPQRKKDLFQKTDALAVEMEAAGIAQLARKYSIPFTVIKTVADKLTSDNSIATDYMKFLNSSAQNAAVAFEWFVELS